MEDVKVRAIARHYDKLSSSNRHPGEIYEIPRDSAQRREARDLVTIIEDQQFTGPDENQQMSPVEETKEATGVGVVPDEENLGREYPEDMPEAQNPENPAYTEDDLPDGYSLERKDKPEEDGPLYQVVGPDGMEVQGLEGDIAWDHVSTAVASALEAIEAKEEFDPWDYIEQRGSSSWYDVEDHDESPVQGKDAAVEAAKEVHG